MTLVPTDHSGFPHERAHYDRFWRKSGLSEVRAGCLKTDNVRDTEERNIRVCSAANSSQFLLLRHFYCKQYSCARGPNPCDPLSGDVIGRAVGRRTYGKRKATEQRNATIEAH